MLACSGRSITGAPLRWKFEPKPESYAQGVACCDVVNRGLAYAAGRLFFNTLDNQTIALDAASGKELWRYRSGDIRSGSFPEYGFSGSSPLSAQKLR